MGGYCDGFEASGLEEEVADEVGFSYCYRDFLADALGDLFDHFGHQFTSDSLAPVGPVDGEVEDTNLFGEKLVDHVTDDGLRLGVFNNAADASAALEGFEEFFFGPRMLEYIVLDPHHHGKVALVVPSYDRGIHFFTRG